MFDTVTLNAFAWGYSIRDVFATLPMPLAINGSLWSLRFEFGMYLALLPVAFLGLRRWRWVALVAYAVSLFALVLLLSSGVLLFSGTWWIFTPGDYPLLVFSCCSFFGGCVLYVYRDQVPVSPVLFGFALVCIVLLVRTGATSMALALFLPYVVIVGGTVPWLSWWGHRVGDFSYGTYLWAWPMQQLVQLTTHTTSGHRWKFVGGSGPGGWVAEVEAAGGVEGVFRSACAVAGG